MKEKLKLIVILWPLVLLIGFMFVAFSIKKNAKETLIPIPVKQAIKGNHLNDDDDDNEELPPSNADFKEFIELAEEVYEYRKDRLPDFEAWSKMAEEPNTIILDARSKEAFDKLHVKGAINFDFSDFDAPKLAKIVPNKDTKILIYCNNNFFDAPNWNDSASNEEKVKPKEPVKYPQGPAGPVGPNKQNAVGSGPVGVPGPKGPAGPTGATGVTGAQGPAGPASKPSPNSVKGVAGLDGSKGPTGPMGYVGPNNTNGTKGTKNAIDLKDTKKGIPGPKGPSGPYVVMEGIKSLNPQGPAGPPATQGPQSSTSSKILKGNSKQKSGIVYKTETEKIPKNDSPKLNKWQWNPDNPDGSPLALNIPIYINLYYYGYKNLYELGESVPLTHPNLELEGSTIK